MAVLTVLATAAAIGTIYYEFVVLGDISLTAHIVQTVLAAALLILPICLNNIHSDKGFRLVAIVWLTGGLPGGYIFGAFILYAGLLAIIASFFLRSSTTNRTA